MSWTMKDARDDGIPQSFRDYESNLIRAMAAKRHQERKEEQDALEAYGQLLDAKAAKVQAPAVPKPEAAKKVRPLKCPVGAKFSVADQVEIVTFTIFSEEIVRIDRKRDSADWLKRPWLNINPHRMTTLSLANARKLYAELLAQGYSAW